MEVQEVKTEWNNDIFGLDFEIIKDRELVVKLCTEEIHIKDELEDVPINERDEVQLTGNSNICQDQHSKLPEMKMEVSPVELLDTYYSTEATGNDGSYISNSQYFKRKSSVQEASADVKYFRGFSNKSTHAVKETEQSCEVCCYKNCYLNSNLTDHTDQQHFKCYNCKFSSSLKRYLIPHMRIHKKLLECNVSNYRTDNKATLVQRNQNYAVKKPYACKFSKKSVLIKRIHTGKKPYTCDICSNKFSSKSNLTEHNIRIHTVEKPYACDICNYRSGLKSELNKHNRIHTGDKPYACNTCSFKCSHKSTLSDHIRIHTGEKPYACNVCGYKCSKKSTLTTHIRIHTGEKPYACNTCSFKCSNKSNLNHHIIRIHTGEKPYACDICSYKFSSKYLVTRHNIRIHNGEKPYACDTCSFKCSEKSSLTKHIRVHTG